MPTIDLTDAEHAALTALIKRAIEQDHFPNAPRLDPLRSALEKLDPATAAQLRRPLTPESPPPPTAQNPQRPPTHLLRRSTPSRRCMRLPMAGGGGFGSAIPSIAGLHTQPREA
jgi:hypothetical protein